MSAAFSFNEPATTAIYTLSLHDALPIYDRQQVVEGAHASRRLDLHAIGDRAAHERQVGMGRAARRVAGRGLHEVGPRSEEHTSELQSRLHLVCRLLLEKKKDRGSG